MPGWLSLYRVRVSTCSGTSPWVFRRYRARRSFLDPKKRALGGLSSIWGEGTGRRYQEIRSLPIPHMGPAFSTLSPGGGLGYPSQEGIGQGGAGGEEPSCQCR